MISASHASRRMVETESSLTASSANPSRSDSRVVVTMSRAGAPWESGGRSVSKACWAVWHQRVPHPGPGVARVVDQLEPSCSSTAGAGAVSGMSAALRRAPSSADPRPLTPDAAGAVGRDREVSAQVGGRVPPGPAAVRASGPRRRGRPHATRWRPVRARSVASKLPACSSRVASPRAPDRGPDGRASTALTMMSACSGDTVPAAIASRVAPGVRSTRGHGPRPGGPRPCGGRRGGSASHRSTRSAASACRGRGGRPRRPHRPGPRPARTGLARPAPRSRPGRRRSGSSTTSHPDPGPRHHPRQHSRGAGLGVEVRDRHRNIESETTDTQTGYPQEYRRIIPEKNMRIRGSDSPSQPKAGNGGRGQAAPVLSFKPKTATTHGPQRADVLPRGGFETVAERPPQPPEASDLLNHRRTGRPPQPPEAPAARRTGSRRAARGWSRWDQYRETPYALSASVTGWKNVVPPVLQLPLPPEVRPRALVPSYSGPPSHRPRRRRWSGSDRRPCRRPGSARWRSVPERLRCGPRWSSHDG